MLRPVLALTGGIACGKSEVQKVFISLGLPVIDLDKIAHTLSKPNSPAMQALKAQFGAEYFNAQEELDRAKLRSLVFNDSAALAQLNHIMHPAIYEEAMQILAQYQNLPYSKALDKTKTSQQPDDIKVSYPYIVLSIPLLVESSCYFAHTNHVVVIDCSVETQLKRLMQDRGLPETQAQAMLKAQSSREQRLAIADTVIDNEGSIATLHDNVYAFHRQFVSADFE